MGLAITKRVNHFKKFKQIVYFGDTVSQGILR